MTNPAKMTNAEKRAAVDEALLGGLHRTISDRGAARALGVSPIFLSRIRQAMEASGTIAPRTPEEWRTMSAWVGNRIRAEMRKKRGPAPVESASPPPASPPNPRPSFMMSPPPPPPRLRVVPGVLEEIETGSSFLACGSRGV